MPPAERPSPGGGTTRDPIAIVGIGCRFPGGVDSPRAFWRLLHDGGDAIREVPPDRFDAATLYDPRPATPGKLVSRWGGFLDAVDRFDPAAFGIAPREAERMDPQQRLLLEVAWEALEDAGLPLDALAGSPTGVFVGLWLNDYEARLFRDPTGVDFYMTTGTGRYSASGRLSYTFGLQGPSLTLDTACSSSLVAVHLACRSLWAGECDLALAGGANAILQPQISIAYSQAQMLAPDGRCKFGDARANGYVRSEGAGVVVLKRLSRALADRDPVYAVIRGSAVNNDGRTSGFLATPGQAGQQELLAKAYRDAGVAPARVGYVEAHGTGTSAGDPVELGALGAVVGAGRAADRPCLVGSVKTNIGHTEGAAGIAGLIKAALVLQQRQIPATLHFEQPNPNIPWGRLGLVVRPELTAWPDDDEPAIAGVSAFGIAGTNAHVVLEEAPRALPQADPAPATEGAQARLLPLSAHSAEALAALASKYQDFLTAASGAPALGDLCYTASARRAHREHRLAVVARDRAELAEHLGAYLRGELCAGLALGAAAAGERPKVAFIFPGQGAQWLGMARQLLAQEPVFRAAIERCAAAISACADWSLLDELLADEAHSRLAEIDVVQPTLFAIQVALAALWQSWGVEPDAVVGHSMGEVAAAHVAGALSLADAARIICRRSRLLRRTSGQGAMAVVELSFDEARAEIAGYEQRLAVAVSNGPRSTVLSGDPAALAEVLERLERRAVFCRPVKVDVASHSPQMGPLRADLHQALAELRPTAAALPIYSTVLGAVADGATLDAAYWVRNLREPVLFWTAMQRLLDDEHTIFIELSPHPVLLPAIQQGLQHAGRAGLALPSMRRGEDERAVLLGTLGALYTAGYPLDWSALYPAGGQVVPLPTYPWQRERYWLDVPASQPATQHGPDMAADPLLGRPLPELAQLPGSRIWESRLDGQARQYLGDEIEGDASPRALPERYYEDMALAAARAVYGPKPHAVTALTIHQPLSVVAGAAPTVQLVLTADGAERADFRLFSRADEAAAWTEQASGSVRLERAEPKWLYELAWEPKPRAAGQPAALPSARGAWWVFMDRGGTGEAVARRLEAAGARCVRAFRADACGVAPGDPARVSLDPTTPDAFKHTIGEALDAAGPCRGIVYLWGLDLPAAEGLAPAALEQDLLGCDAVLYLAQALAALPAGEPPRLWVVTRGAQPVGAAGAGPLAVAQAPLWGLGRCLALDCPTLWGGLLDLPPRATEPDAAAEAALLCAELLAGDGEDQLALRAGQRYVARLRRSASVARETTP
ncbi:MAG TPA: type I polyketide synthase, partial [Chloroflexota bacterium]|nr:type I polyketide synthase [Chloroflexota bacterium]